MFFIYAPRMIESHCTLQNGRDKVFNHTKGRIKQTMRPFSLPGYSELGK